MYLETVSLGEDFFAFEEKEVKALDVSVVGENIEVYAVMSLFAVHVLDICILTFLNLLAP